MLNILVAYPYMTDKNIELLANYERSKYSLIIDSGAFSAFNSGKEIKFEDYRTFLKKIDFLKPDACVQLDVVSDSKKTKLNYQRHLDAGDNVCPVFTRGDDWDYMQSLLDQDKYVFVGGVAQSNGQAFAKYCLERSKNKKVHYLAFVRSNWLKHYKPFSVDCSSWSTSTRFGSLCLYMGDGKLKTLSRQDFVSRPKDIILKKLNDLGFDYDQIKQLALKDNWTSKRSNDPKNPLNLFVSISSYIKYSSDAENIIGTKIYMAMNFDHYTKMVLTSNDYLKQKGVI